MRWDALRCAVMPCDALRCAVMASSGAYSGNTCVSIASNSYPFSHAIHQAIYRAIHQAIHQAIYQVIHQTREQREYAAAGRQMDTPEVSVDTLVVMCYAVM